MQSLSQRLCEKFRDLPAINTLWIAYSGGVDSHVLLHSLNTLRAQLNVKSLRALYINHQLHPDSARWGQHCASVCHSLGVEYNFETVSISCASGESLEASARDARYRVFRQYVKAGDCLLTAHHQDDQAETLLLQLLRGSGPHGLAAMPAVTQFAEGYHARPLLDIGRAEILEYAAQFGLQWIEDSSNTSEDFDRNFLRLNIIPLLRKRWPACARTLARSASLCADAVTIMDQHAQQLLQSISTEQNDQLPVAFLASLPEIECRNVLHYWLDSLGLPLPSYAQMQQIMITVIHARPDAEPLVHWPGAEIRRYGNTLYAMKPLEMHDHLRIIHWNPGQTIAINGVGQLAVEPAETGGIDADRLKSADISIRFRQGGERCQLSGHKLSHTLKHLFQQWRIPPWLRDRVPLIYADEELAIIAGYGVCEGFSVPASAPGRKGLKLIWRLDASGPNAVIKSRT